MLHRSVILSIFIIFLCSEIFTKDPPPSEDGAVDTGASKEFWKANNFHYFDFKSKVIAGDTECFYQYIHTNSSFNIIWHVMSASYAGELAAIVTLKSLSDNKMIYESAYGQMGQDYQLSVDKGTYEVCIDNTDSYSNKVVYLWIDYYAHTDWDGVVSQDDEVQAAKLKHDVIRNTLMTLEIKMADMLHFQAVYRERNVADESSVVAVLRLIDNSSTFALILIIVTGVIQIVFLRNLFNVPNNMKSINAAI